MQVVAGRAFGAGQVVGGFGLAPDDAPVEPASGPLPNSRCVLVSFSVNSSSAAPSAKKRIGATLGWRAQTDPSEPADNSGFSVPAFHDHRFRAQSCGSRVRSAGSGPRLVAVTRISTSSGPALA
jgi:hypothetical protein